jgi:hypothetical protein
VTFDASRRSRAPSRTCRSSRSSAGAPAPSRCSSCDSWSDRRLLPAGAGVAYLVTRNRRYLTSLAHLAGRRGAAGGLRPALRLRARALMV